MNQEHSTPTPQDPREQLQEKILAEYPRLGPDDTFKFSCHPGIACFNQCCGDVNIFLTPYDVLRLKNRLGMKAGDFLDKYTIMPIQKDMKTPVIILRMNDDEAKSCPFLTEKGCGIYSDRPWPCRMYPVGEASPKDAATQGAPFYFILQDEICRGLEEAKEWTIREWLENQGVAEYDELGQLFKDLTLHDRIQRGAALEIKQMDMFHMALYDQDKFREFLFDSTFFKRFEVEPERVEKLRESELERLKFAHRWLSFCLLGQKVIKVKGGAVDEVKE